MASSTQSEDGKECTRLEAELLTPDQRAALKRDERSPRWDLDPPQREEYDTAMTYMLGVARYADRLLAREAKTR